MTKLATKLQTRLNVVRDRGATAVEYGLMVALIAAVVIAGATLLGKATGNTFNDVSTKI